MVQVLANMRQELAATSTPEEIHAMEMDCIMNFDSYYMQQHGADLQRILENANLADQIHQQTLPEDAAIMVSDDEGSIYQWEQPDA